MDTVCDKCKRVFAHPSGLLKHLRRRRPCVSDKACSFCGVMFKLPYQLARHLSRVVNGKCAGVRRREHRALLKRLVAEKREKCLQELRRGSASSSCLLSAVEPEDEKCAAGLHSMRPDNQVISPSCHHPQCAECLHEAYERKDRRIKCQYHRVIDGVVYAGCRQRITLATIKQLLNC